VTKSRFWLGLVLLLIVVFGLPAGLARGQGAIQVSASSATTDFPTSITFQVTAADSGADINSLYLLYKAGTETVTHEAKPTFSPGRQVKGEYVLDTQVNYIPPGLEISYRWSVGDSQGNTFESDAKTVVYHDQRFQWQQLNQDKVTVFWYDGGQSFGQDVLDTSLRTLDRLAGDIGAKVEDPIKIYVYGNRDDFYGALPPNSSEWIGGESFSDQNLIVADIAADSGASDEIKRVIPHEISHIVVHQATKNPYNGPPLWLDEGLAVHNQEVKGADFDGTVADAARQGQLIPLRALSSNFPTDPTQADLSYAESQSVVEYILKVDGAEKMTALINTFKDGVTYDDALKRSLDTTINQLDQAWRGTLPAPEVTPTPLPTLAPTAVAANQPTIAPQSEATAVPADTPVPAETNTGGLVALGTLGVVAVSLPVVVVAGVVILVVVVLRRGH
jgi:hypothetical protein